MIQIEWDIIERKLKGELTSEEEARFKEWYAADKSNENYFRKIEKFYRENGFVKEITDEQVNMSWNKFKARSDGKDNRKTGRRFYYWVASGVAACLLIGVFLFMTLWQEDRPVTNTTILAGGNKATLTLSNGKIIPLENRSDEMEDVTAKIINTGSSLNYTKKSDTLVVEEIAYNQIQTPKGGEYRLTLADGTKVYLGSLSSLEYPVTFTGKDRKVKLSGEAYFEVARDVKHPFIVELDNMTAKVLGTSFNLRDYADEQYAEATLVTGKVQIFAGQDSCILEPSYQATLDRSTRVLSSKKVDVSEFVAWKDGKLNIRNQRLEDILIRLSKWYDINIFYANKEAKDLRFYVNIDRYSDLNELLDKFEKTDLVRFEIKGNVVKVMTTK